MEKEKLYKRALIILTAAIIVVTAVITTRLAVWYETSLEEMDSLKEKLTQAQDEIEALETANAEYKEREAVLAAMAEVTEEEEIELQEIPFEVDLKEWNYLLVNEKNPLPQDFEVELEKTYDGHQVDTRMRNALEEMIDAGNETGLKIMICSSFRTYKKQDTLLDNSIKKHMRTGLDYTAAFFKARERIALPGTSEHHTGLAVDLVGRSHQSLDAAQADTQEAKWLKEHAHEYGFILRYPKEKEDLTMIKFESWHFRYVGVEAAAFMKENDLCMEEFVELVRTWEALEEENEQEDKQH